ncbi:aromatic hydrocarbon degradation protein [Paracoccus sp. M683]|uniref:OmpP1/FadL family transporter n=1 Tax=Paracoccus sp. M683 TaxID=2594268 RepID=UPI00117C66C2|nr:outer membrane protein transport protein [Paracoccus sp. M683]TRW97824.1 aromatic hydrocarbon degradation protein [Paracoccus sp. M683]
MKFAIAGAAALLMGSTAAMAGGIERAPHSLGALFEPGENFVELSFGHVSPDVTGRDEALFGGSSIGNVADNYNFFGLAYKRQFNENLSAALIIEQPFGADILYPTPDGAGNGSIALGGTAATVDSTTFTALVRYRMDNNFGFHGGLRGSRADGSVTLRGCAYSPDPSCTGGVNGYNVDLDTDTAVGWTAGVSWEKPEIAARVSLTYNSPIEHEFKTTETIAGFPIDPAGTSTTKVKTPRSWNLEFQTGVAADTLVFGSIRWVNWSEFRVDPRVFTTATGGGLVELEDTTTYTLGVGRKFTEKWSGSASFTFEKSGDDLVSPLAPTNGKKGITLAAIYTQDNIKVTTGINYTKLGDASPETGTPDTARAQMEDNDVLGIGVRVGFTF